MRGEECPLPRDLPRLPDEWQWCLLRDLIEPSRGISYGIVQPGSYDPAGVPILRADNIQDGHIQTADVLRVSGDIESSYTRTRLRGGEVLLTVVGAYFGRAAIAPLALCGWNVARAVAVVPVMREIESEWVALCLRSPAVQYYIQNWATTTAQPTLNLRDVARLPIPLPPKREREWVTQFLCNIEKKIELNWRMNETLEAIARAIFKSWFVDFDPVRAKADGCQPAGMSLDLAALFPSKFVRSGESTLPEGWAVRPLDEIGDFLNGLALQKFPPTGNNDLPVIKIAELRRGNTIGSDWAARTIPPDYVVCDGDVLFSWSGSLEVVLWCGGVGALNQHLFKVTSCIHPKWFYYEWIKEHLPNFQAIAAGKATTMGHIQRHHLTEAMVVVPPDPVLQATDRLIAPLLERVVANSLESRTLAALRDTLLPKLLSGEIRVKQAEKMVGAAQ